MAEDPTTEQRLDHIEEAMVYFNRRQNEDLALSQEFKAVRKAIYIAAAALICAIVMMSFV